MRCKLHLRARGEKPFTPNWKMLGGEGGVYVEQRSTIMGSAPAVMATFKLRF